MSRLGKTICAAISMAAVAGAGTGLLDRTDADAAAAASKPNIVFVILDDVGIDQMKLFGFGGVKPASTPNMNLLAAHGVKFTNVWAMPECSPSRAAFFTGRYPIRTGVVSAIVNNHLPQDYVSSFEATLPRVLAKAGYVSSLIGKYHLGNEKDPAGNCAPATRGWQSFVGNMSPGPPSIDTTAGDLENGGNQICGYHQGPEAGSCYTRASGTTKCQFISAANAEPGATPARTCLQRGGLFRPFLACGNRAPSEADFNLYNAYYVWPRTTTNGVRSPLSTNDACTPVTSRTYMTQQQSDDGASWWKKQSGPRMLTLSYNSIHTPYQKAPTSIVPDPGNPASTCSSVAPPRPLLNNMLEAADVEIGRFLANAGLGTLHKDGRTLATLDLRNTVVVIVGDNGSYGPSVRVLDNFDVNRSKATVYQTGVWVPLIVAGSPVAQPGRSVGELINVTDLFQLFGDLAGIKVGEIVPPSHILDSKPMLPYLTTPNAAPIRTTSFTQVGAGTFTPNPSERSWPCQIGNTCNDTLIWNKALCDDNGGTWYGPGGQKQLTSCCAVIAGTQNATIIPVSQYAVRDKRYKVVEVEQTDCKTPLAKGAKKPFPWAEFRTKVFREFYDLKPTSDNPTGMDFADNNLLKNCKEGQDPVTCLPQSLRGTYSRLANELDSVKASAKPQTACQMKGDGNLDLRVNQADIDGWKTFNGKGPSQYDINLDGETDEKDLAIIQAHLGTDCLDICVRADLNRDGKVDSRDLALLTSQSGTCDGVLCGGDLDGDGKVDSRDVRLMTSAQATCRAR